MALQEHRLPKTMNFNTLNVDDIMAITARLNTILIEESNLLGAMKVKEIAPLQAEKHKLSQQITAFQKQISVDNTIVKQAPEDKREQLINMTDDLNYTIEENLRRTVIAQTVNQRVMATLTEAIAKTQRPALYGRKGQHNNGPDITVSVNINEKA